MKKTAVIVLVLFFVASCSGVSSISSTSSPDNFDEQVSGAGEGDDGSATMEEEEQDTQETQDEQAIQEVGPTDQEDGGSVIEEAPVEEPAVEDPTEDPTEEEPAEDPEEDPVEEDPVEEVFDPSAYTVWVARTNSAGGAIIAGILASEGYAVAYPIEEAQIVSGITADLLVIPGGTAALDLGRSTSVQTAVRSAVSGGVGFIGVCGGAIAGSTSLYVNVGSIEYAVPGYDMLGLLNVRGLDNTDWMNNYMNSSGSLYPYNIEILMGDHEIVSPNENETLVMAYRAGPVLKFENPADTSIEILGSFNEDLDPSSTAHTITGEPAIVAGEYGAGKVFLTSVHPEYSGADVDYVAATYPAATPVDDVQYLYVNAARWILEE